MMAFINEFEFAFTLFAVCGGLLFVFCIPVSECLALLSSRAHVPGIDVPKARGVLITAVALVKQKDWFFVLAQSEYGDLYKIILVRL
jgi:hypothetical protein